MLDAVKGKHITEVSGCGCVLWLRKWQILVKTVEVVKPLGKVKDGLTEKFVKNWVVTQSWVVKVILTLTAVTAW